MKNSPGDTTGNKIYLSKRIIGLSILINIIAIFAAIVILLKYGDKIYKKLANTSVSKNKICKIAIAGDSRVEMGYWEKGLQRDDVKNCAIGGSLTSGYLKQLNNAVIRYHPKICVLQIGINDIRNKVSVDTAEKYYNQILDSLLNHKIEPVVTSIIFLRKDFWQDDISETDINSKTDSLNQKLTAICQTRNITYLDLNKYLAANNRLKREYTFDGIHLNNAGYDLFYKEVSDYLKRSNE